MLLSYPTEAEVLAAGDGEPLGKLEVAGAGDAPEVAGAGDAPEVAGAGDAAEVGDAAALGVLLDDGDGDGCGGTAYRANTSGRFACNDSGDAVALNATYSGGRAEAPNPAPTGGGVNAPGMLDMPKGVLVGNGVGIGVTTGDGKLPGAGLLRSRSATAR